MKTFFRPASVAVIGASESEGSLGGQIIANLLHGYKEPIYPVNPNYEEIKGLRCFPTVDAIPASVDMAIIIVPAPAVPAVLEACGRKGIYRVIIESAGFSEAGPEGKALQDKCTAIAKAAGIRVWGPNCMGIVDIPGQRYFTFMHPNIYKVGLIPGRISMVVQSGMLTAGFLADLMGDRAIGVAKACSIGNKSDVDECDILEYLLHDDETDAIALYLESIPRGRRFIELANQSSKPIVVLKGGRSSAGAKAAMSHTSSLAGNARLQDSVLTQAGVTIAHDFQQMMELTRALAMIPDTPPHCRTAIITLSGGAGILSCDLLEEQGLSVAELSPETKKELAAVFPDWFPSSNPVDLYPAFALKGPIAAYDGAFNAVIKDPNVDVIFIHYFAGLYPSYGVLPAIKAAADKAGKVIIMWVIGLSDSLRTFKRDCQESGIPAHGELSRAVECLAAASRYQRRKPIAANNAEAKPVLSSGVAKLVSKGKGRRIWDEFDSKQLLALCDIPVVDEQIAKNINEAASLAQKIGYPVVMKGLAPGEVHKTESGLVCLNLANSAGVKSAFEELMKRMSGQGRILLQRQLSIDYELIAGYLLDAQFGPCVMFGLGGIFSELQRDVVFATAPLTEQSALELIFRIKGSKLLQGFRGMKPINEKAMAGILVNLGNLGAACPAIEQIDINPLIVSGGNPVAVDASIILKNDLI
jgi:acyl-CoA synthetase (NDP forming)